MLIQKIAEPEVVNQYIRPSKLNVFMIDVSGSMYWAMNRLRSEIERRIKDLPDKDAVCIGLFSSEGWFRWIVNRALNAQTDYDFVVSSIVEQLYARNMTCFSEILNDVPNAIQPFLNTYQVVTVTFMSDGHPVVSNYAGEESKIQSAVEKLRPYVTSGAIIAYGDYANKPLLGKIAATLGVELVSAAEPEEIGLTFGNVVGGKATKKRKVKVAKKTKYFFTADEDFNVAIVEPTNDEVSIPENVMLYGLCDEDGDSLETFTSYLTAKALIAQNKLDEALEALLASGDVHLINLLYNAITNADLKLVEQTLHEALFDPTTRFKNGQVEHYKPRDDAFDLIDLLDLLLQDECLFYPSHSLFKYKKIGRDSTVREGYPKFNRRLNQGVPLSRVVGNEKELNISIGCVLQGTIDLPDEVTTSDGVVLNRTAVNLPETYDAIAHRNYAIIANAMPSVSVLPISGSEALFNKLHEKGLVDSEHWNPNEVFGVHLNRVPACNKARGKTACDWEKLASLALDSVKLGAKAKVYKAKLNELDPDKERKQPVSWTDEQYAFLSAIGVRADNSYSPPVDTLEATDVLDVRTLEVKVKNSSSVSMNDFTLMVKGDKKMNWMGTLMNEAQSDINSSMPEQKTAAIEWLDKQFKATQLAKQAIDMQLNANRYAIAVGGHWNKNFDTNEHKVTLGDNVVTFICDTITKKI